MSSYTNTANLIPTISTSRWEYFGSTLKIFQNPVTFLSDAHQMYGDVFQLATRPHNALFAPTKKATSTIFVFGAENIHQIMRDTDTFHQVPLVGKLLPQQQSKCPYQTALRRLGGGLLALNGQAHTEARQLLMPAFQRQQIESYMAEMVSLLDERLAHWSAETYFDIKEEISQIVLHTAGRVLLGVDFSGRYAPLGQLIQQWLHLLSNPLLFMLPYNLPGTPYRRFLKLSRQLNEALVELIHTRQAQPEAERPDDILSVLIAAATEPGSTLDEAAIVGHLHTLFAAGLDSTSNAIAWLLLLLNQHPRITQNLYEELDKQPPGHIPSSADFDQLPYLDMVIKEGLRLAPALMSLRTTARPTQLGRFEIPQGAEIIFSHYHTHRQPEIYANPHAFVPERWETITPSPYDYIPFSTGRRMCIGATYAQMQIKLFLTMVLQRYRFQLAPALHLDPIFNVTIGFKQVMPLTVYAQDGLFWRSKSSLHGGVTELVKFD